MTVSCIIPAYNEGTRVASVIRAARGCAEVDEVIVVSDGSTDDTVEQAAAAGAHRVVVLPDNRGKGDAVMAGIAAARGEVLLLVDADLLGLRPEHLRRLLQPVLAGRAEMTVGTFSDDPRHARLAHLSGQRALRRSLLGPAQDLGGTGFGFEMALNGLARQVRARVLRVPLSGLDHQRKRQKYGTLKGFRKEMRSSVDILRQAHRVVLPAAASESWEEPPNRPASKPWPELPGSGFRPLLVVLGLGGLLQAAAELPDGPSYRRAHADHPLGAEDQQGDHE